MGELGIARLAAYFVRRRWLEALFQLSFPSLLSWLVLEKYHLAQQCASWHVDNLHCCEEACNVQW